MRRPFGRRICLANLRRTVRAFRYWTDTPPDVSEIFADFRRRVRSSFAERRFGR
jgi:hypothetical protein